MTQVTDFLPVTELKETDLLKTDQNLKDNHLRTYTGEYRPKMMSWNTNNLKGTSTDRNTK